MLLWCVCVTEGHLNEAWPQGAAQTGIEDRVSQEKGFHVSASSIVGHPMHAHYSVVS